MNVVIDASGILAVLVDEPEADAIVAATVDKQLLAPLSLHWEVGNALSSMLKQRRITPADLDRLIDGFFQISIRFVDIDFRAAVALAARLNIYAYDAYMLQCSLQVNEPLLTLDRRLRESAGTVGVATVGIGHPK